MSADSAAATERLLELRDLATGEVRRFAIVREDAQAAGAAPSDATFYEPSTAETAADARAALTELYGGPLDQTDDERRARLEELGLSR